MKLNAEQVARIIVENAEPNLPKSSIPKTTEPTDSQIKCQRIVQLIKELEPLNSILNAELYELCKSMYEIYSDKEKIDSETIASLLTQLTNKIVYHT